MRFFQTAPLKLIILLLLVALGTTNSFAQRKPRGNTSSITGQKFKMKAKQLRRKKQINYINSIKLIAGFGSAGYFGDLCSGIDCMTPRLNLVLGGEYRLDESITLRTELNFLKLSGDDAKGENIIRNLSFNSTNIEWSATVLYDLFEYNKMYRRRHIFSPYLFLGVGIVTVAPKATLDGTTYALRPLQTEGNSYGSVAFAVPYGGGVKIKINPVLNVTLEAGYRWTFTDYLDDVSTTYSTTLTDATAIALSDRRREWVETLTLQETQNLTPGQIYDIRGQEKRGNADRNDGYFLFQIKGEYTMKVTKQHYNINSNVSRFRIIKSIKKR